MKPIKAFVACVASISAQVRRESWDESKKKECRRIGVHAADRTHTQILSLLILAAILNKFPLSMDKSVM